MAKLVDTRTGHSSQKTKIKANKPKKPTPKQMFFFSKQVSKTMTHESEKYQK